MLLKLSCGRALPRPTRSGEPRGASKVSCPSVEASELDLCALSRVKRRLNARPTEEERFVALVTLGVSSLSAIGVTILVIAILYLEEGTADNLSLDGLSLL